MFNMTGIDRSYIINGVDETLNIFFVHVNNRLLNRKICKTIIVILHSNIKYVMSYYKVII